MKNDISYQKYLFHQGTNYKCYEFLGVHRADDGWVFRVWAPQAAGISLVGGFNGWDLSADPMERLSDDESIWEIHTDKVNEGDLYKFAVQTVDDRKLYKADPYAFAGEGGDYVNGSQRCSAVKDMNDGFEWHDGTWIYSRSAADLKSLPLNIYEVNAGSWRTRKDGSFMTYRETADLLIPYVKDMGYNYIELMPVSEYPFLGSWGYQVTGYYSVSSRFGTAEDLKYFMDKAHTAGIGVIFDWVPAHFPKDECGLMEFDGHPLYEDSNPYRMEHKSWGTRAFDFGRPEVLSFLISNACYLCEEFHADGLRVDAVAAMLYLDYDRPDGEWAPNAEGGKENREAIHFLQSVNSAVRGAFPGVLMVAEESTAWPHVTGEPGDGGLGFSFKWNMGWMNDALNYYSHDAIFRGGMHHMLTFSLTYAYSENYILPISHDEVVHGKCSMIEKMPGEYDQKFAQLRTFYTYMMSHPGKKLTFMGCEFAQFIEWNEAQELDWLLLDYDRHRQMQEFVRTLNKLYLETPALWEQDCSYYGFNWIDADNTRDNVYSYYRSDKKGNIVLVIINNSGRDFPAFDVGVPGNFGTGKDCAEQIGRERVRTGKSVAGKKKKPAEKQGIRFEKVMDTDMIRFGGTGKRRKKVYVSEDGTCNGQAQHITLALPAYSGIMLVRK